LLQHSGQEEHHSLFLLLLHLHEITASGQLPPSRTEQRDGAEWHRQNPDPEYKQTNTNSHKQLIKLLSLLHTKSSISYNDCFEQMLLLYMYL